MYDEILKIILQKILERQSPIELDKKGATFAFFSTEKIIIGWPLVIKNLSREKETINSINLKWRGLNINAEYDGWLIGGNLSCFNFPIRFNEWESKPGMLLFKPNVAKTTNPVEDAKLIIDANRSGGIEIPIKIQLYK